MLTSKHKEGEKEGMFGYQYINIGCSSIGEHVFLRIGEHGKQDAEVADGYLDQSQEDWCVLRSEDP